MIFKTLGVAIAFSPRAHALLAEAARLKALFQARLIIIHVGASGHSEEGIMHKLLADVGLTPAEVTLCWRTGKPASEILKACTEQGVELLITGALKKEGFLQHYLGSVARNILRRSDCSVLTLINPSLNPVPFRNIVVEAEANNTVRQTLSVACRIGLLENASWLHVVREIKLYSLTMATTAGQVSEEEYSKLKKDLVTDEVDTVQRLMMHIPHKGLKVNIKVITGKSGFETARFAREKRADLLVVSAPPRQLSFFDRLFPHDLEYVFADLPCNLLVLHNNTGKEGGHA
jgi:nucleotide-binding universal stress UspA family protein